VATVVLALMTAIHPTPVVRPALRHSVDGHRAGQRAQFGQPRAGQLLRRRGTGRAAIEARLSLGATIHEALADLTRSSIRRGMIPIVNQMSAAGVITLPGIMTGQLIAGMDPIEAAKYQILLLFLLTGAGGLAAAGAVYMAARSLTDERQRLRIDRLS
jgi:putative ABC transport system permease protein